MIRRLQNDLHQIQKFSEEHIKRTKSEAEKQEAADVKNSDGKKGKLQQEIAQLRTQMQALTSEHRESEQTLRKVSILHTLFNQKAGKNVTLKSTVNFLESFHCIRIGMVSF